MDHKAILRAVLTTVLCVPGVVLNVGLAFNFAAGNNGIDFNQFYSASRLAGTGHLYDFARLRVLEAEHGPPIPSGRLPVVSWGMKPLTRLPYFTARVVWLCASIVALILVGALWPGVNRHLMFLALAWSKPVGFLLALGQDTPFWLLFFCLGLLLLHRKNPNAAGAVFSMCVCKYHLALGLPVMLAAQKRWKTLAAGASAIALLLAACFVIEGRNWVRSYLDVLFNPIFSISFGRMANLHGLASYTPASGLVEIVAALAVVALLWNACRRILDPALSGALAAAAGLLLGHHGYVNDCALLIPLAVLLLFRPDCPVWLKFWAGLTLTPVTVSLFTGSYPILGELLVIGFVLAALVCYQKRARTLLIPLPRA